MTSGLRFVSLAFGLATIALLSEAAHAQRFAPTPVTGIKVLAGNPNPVTVFENRTFLSSATLCGEIQRNKGLIDQAVNQAMVVLNQRIAAHIKGVSIVRHELTLSRSCSAVADGATATNPQGGLNVNLKMPGTRFAANITTPDAEVLGAKIGLPQGADPRIEISFDLEATVQIAVPRTLGERLRAGSATVAVFNVSHPRGLNFTGKLAGAAADAATSVYDHFNKGEIGLKLAQGHAFSGAIPAGVLDSANRSLDPYRSKLSSLQVQVDPQQALLVLQATDGKKVADPRCISGYVWRAIRSDDLVCVKPEIRAQVQADNRQAGERRVSEPDRAMLTTCGGVRPDPACTARAYRIPCKQGFVWREAIADDYVCVTPATRQQARDDNSWAQRRRMDYEAVIR